MDYEMDVEHALALLLSKNDRGSILIADLIHRMDSRLRFLNCLEIAGIDSWDGFDYAQQLYCEGEGS